MLVPARRPVTSPAGVLAASFLTTVLLAGIANLVLELWQVGWRPGTAFLQEVRNGQFWLGSLVIWLCVVLVVALVGRLWLGAGIIAVVTLVVSYANYEKLALRLEPLYPSDLEMGAQLGFLTHMIGLGVTSLLVLGIVALLGGAVLLGRLLARWFPPVDRHVCPGLARGLLVTRVVGLAMSLLALGYISGFNEPGNRFRDAYEASGVKWRFWNQSTNYQANGFVGGLLYNLGVPAMTRPADYSKATMDRLTAKYAAQAARINRGRNPRALNGVNVVLVLSESFTDPTRFQGVKLAQDPIPFTRSLMRRTPAGNMLSPKYGGGTANVEFSALTGMSLSQFQPQLNTPYQMLVPNYAQFPSMVGYFRQLGHRTVAIHPFQPELYRRGQVYPILGFDSITFADEMRHREQLDRSDFISDGAAFSEVLDRLDRSADPLFVNLVTMQNHFPMAGKYDDPIPISGVDDSSARANLEHYARGLRYSDAALRRFLAALNRSKEKTVVLFYGDHLPPVWPQSVRQANRFRVKRETPFFVYKNFGKQQPRRMPTTSPIYFGDLVLDAAGAPLPPYYALLTQLRRQIPALEQNLVIGPDNRPVPAGDLPPKARRLLHDYRLVQYDLSVGSRYSQDALFYPVRAGVTAASGPSR